jgi:plastocyanin
MRSWSLILVVSALAHAQERTASGKALFLDHCAMCHGTEGNGRGELAAELPLKPRDFRHEPLQWGNQLPSVVTTITHGRLEVMPAFEGALTPEQITAVAGYVWSLIPPEGKVRDFSVTARRLPTSRVFLVRQRGNAFVPARLTAKKGDMIVFVNDDTKAHEVNVLGRSSWFGASQSPSQWDRVLLSEAGTSRFGCGLHGAVFEVEVKP